MQSLFKVVQLQILLTWISFFKCKRSWISLLPHKVAQKWTGILLKIVWKIWKTPGIPLFQSPKNPDILVLEILVFMYKKIHFCYPVIGLFPTFPSFQFFRLSAIIILVSDKNLKKVDYSNKSIQKFLSLTIPFKNLESLEILSKSSTIPEKRVCKCTFRL